jgi:hypothetical protein
MADVAGKVLVNVVTSMIFVFIFSMVSYIIGKFRKK